MSSRLDVLDALLLDRLSSIDTVLDIGSGSGNFAAAARAKGTNVVTVDPSKRANADISAAVTLGPAMFVDRRTVRRVAVTQADDTRPVETVTLTALIAAHRPTAIRFRALGQETQLTGIDPSTPVIAHIDRLVSTSLTIPQIALVAGELVRIDTDWPTSRLTIAIGAQWPTERSATDVEWLAAARAEATVTEPARRVRLAHLLEAHPEHHDACADIADQLLADPADQVADAMSWWRPHVSSRASHDRITRHLAAFNRITDLLTAPPGPERPASLPLPV